jgi:predicted DNA binding protein
MATLTYNRVGQVLRFDLSAAEVQIVDAVIAARGISAIENHLNELFREYLQRKRDQEIARIQEKLATLTDAQRQAIVTILNS